jgi:hypothetical protein
MTTLRKNAPEQCIAVEDALTREIDATSTHVEEVRGEIRHILPLHPLRSVDKFGRTLGKINAAFEMRLRRNQ